MLEWHQISPVFFLFQDVDREMEGSSRGLQQYDLSLRLSAAAAGSLLSPPRPGQGLGGEAGTGVGDGHGEDMARHVRLQPDRAPRRGEAGGVVQQVEHRPIHVRPAQGAGLGGGAVQDEVQSPGGAQIPAGGR